MLSAYGTKEQMRISFRDYKVADFLSKHRFSTRQFVATVQHTFEREVRINLDLNILWQHGSSPEQIVEDLEVEEGQRVRAGTALQTRTAQELEDLLCRLFFQAKSILVQPMVAGRSGANVLWVQPFYADGGGGRAVVVKFGNSYKIRQEYHNYKHSVEPFVGGQRCTAILDLRQTASLSGIVYSLLGAIDDQSNKLEHFASFYRRASILEITRTLDLLFTETCGSWYANPGHLQPLNLTEDYQRAFKTTPQKLEQGLQLLPAVATMGSSRNLYFKSLGGIDREFTNPLQAIKHRPFVQPTYVCTTHGDFNQYNLLVDRDGYPWMIDFHETGKGHILRDVAYLDSIVRFQLLEASEATLAERLALEEVLGNVKRFSQLKDLADGSSFKNNNVEKAFAVVVHLRRLARQLINQNPNDNIGEYYVALLYNALNTLDFQNLSVIQREHALLSASLLVGLLELQPLAE